MKRRLFSLPAGALALALLLSACAPGPGVSAAPSPTGTQTPDAYQSITAEEGKALLDEGGALTLLDVRRPDEYEAGHIPGAVNLPNEDIGDTQPEALPDLDATLVVYCRTGVRSRQAAEKLVELGYTDVRDLGGIADWPYETVTGGEPGAYVPEETPAAATGIMGSFSTTDLDGNGVDQGIFEDHTLTMVNVWATYCGPCLQEMPDLGELADEYADKGVRIVGLVSDVLNSDGSLSDSQLGTARDIVSSTGADYLHLVPSQDLYGLLAQITSVPTTFFVDGSGAQVGYAYLGALSKDEWSAAIEEVLAEVAP